MEGKLIVVEEDDPRRCQSVAKHGQCIYQAVEGLPNCPMHAGQAQDRIKKDAVRNYQFQKYRDRINSKADSSVIKSLREEIGILRMILEEVINKCEDDTDLMIYSPKIADLALKIEKVVTSAHKLEQSLGETLDKTSILNISTRLVNVIAGHIKDDMVINAIVEEIGQMVSEA
jgi:hypothetical protein